MSGRDSIDPPRAPSGNRRPFRFLSRALLAFVFATLAIDGTETAVANGDTRTLDIIHEHTKESASITFRRNGQYDPEALKQLNWLLRDWRLDEPIRMEPRLFDIVWQVYREVGSRAPIHVVSGYRSPETNAALRARSRAVAEHSQHMLGKAMDFYLEDVPMSRVREVGMRIQWGGVGFYPNANNPFVHLDAGSVRSWPRMSADQLAHLFPDGRTVHMPKRGPPMPGYEEAKAMILAKGGSVAGYATAEAAEDDEPIAKSLWSALFGSSRDEDAQYYRSAASRAPPLSRVRTASAGDPTVAIPGGTTAPPGLKRSASPAPAEAQTPAAPLPPRRPTGLGRSEPPPSGPILAAVSVPPPIRPAMPPAPSRPPANEMSPAAAPAGSIVPSAPGPDAAERAALASLFTAVATSTGAAPSGTVAESRGRAQPVETAMAAWTATDPASGPGSRVRSVFSSARVDAPPAEAFRGPAVAPLVLVR